MAVKVMLAPAIAKRDAEVAASRAEKSNARQEAGEAKPKRRRSSVYDADGNEVFITLMCLKCHKMRPLAQFGLRRMADGAIRNQPWCRPCRSGASAGKPRRREEAAGAEPTPALPDAAPGAAAELPVDAGLLAAQVVAALHGGRR
ncbi:hypothetical protein [Anaeromyxobacter diazotrophicus]|uniref:Uncharacterized protein n=1 Tax=Anaeromyxobacter diazotrophicus TaxID=2590199 RepID=A0A7I9VKD9_9BACT|nr:hypothetical protein [Anaeromyxobacter diazotrophicus]GEJ56872.1 hypothetical protein AMYX_16130 [Anaeromyxobacter diazotrophicus]